MALPTFFAIDAANGIPYPPRHVSRLEDHEALFDPRATVRGEVSAGHSHHPIWSM